MNPHASDTQYFANRLVVYFVCKKQIGPTDIHS